MAGQGQTGNCLPLCHSLKASAAQGSLLWPGLAVPDKEGHGIGREGLEQAPWGMGHEPFCNVFSV